MTNKFIFKKDNDENIIDLTPMLDIVFIMLIFFIVTTSFVTEAGVDINRPKASTATTQKASNIMIAITSDGDIYIDKRMVDIRALRGNIEKLKAQMPEAGVILVTDVDAKTKYLISVMDEVRQAGITNISIAAETK